MWNEEKFTNLFSIINLQKEWNTCLYIQAEREVLSKTKYFYIYSLANSTSIGNYYKQW